MLVVWLFSRVKRLQLWRSWGNLVLPRLPLVLVFLLHLLLPVHNCFKVWMRDPSGAHCCIDVTLLDIMSH